MVALLVHSSFGACLARLSVAIPPRYWALGRCKYALRTHEISSRIPLRYLRKGLPTSLFEQKKNSLRFRNSFAVTSHFGSCCEMAVGHDRLSDDFKVTTILTTNPSNEQTVTLTAT